MACSQPWGICPQGMQDMPAACPQPHWAMQVAVTQASAGAGLPQELLGIGATECVTKLLEQGLANECGDAAEISTQKSQPHRGAGVLQFITQRHGTNSAAAGGCSGGLQCLFVLFLLAGQQRAGNILNVMTGACALPLPPYRPSWAKGDPLPTSPEMVVRWGEESISSHPRVEAALSSSCCQLTGQTESCYCKDRDHTGPHACPCRKVPWGHLSDTRPASGAGAKGSPPGAVWLGRPALNC